MVVILFRVKMLISTFLNEVPAAVNDMRVQHRHTRAGRAGTKADIIFCVCMDHDGGLSGPSCYLG